MEFAFVWVLFGVAAGVVTAARSQNALGFLAGFVLGVLLGPIGLLIAFFIKPTGAKLMEGKRTCPFCKEPIHAEASVCPHCQRESAPWRWHEGHWWVKGSDGKDYYLKNNQWVSPEP